MALYLLVYDRISSFMLTLWIVTGAGYIGNENGAMEKCFFCFCTSLCLLSFDYLSRKYCFRFQSIYGSSKWLCYIVVLFIYPFIDSLTLLRRYNERTVYLNIFLLKYSQRLRRQDF